MLRLARFDGWNALARDAAVMPDPTTGPPLVDPSRSIAASSWFELVRTGIRVAFPRVENGGTERLWSGLQSGWIGCKVPAVSYGLRRNVGT